MTQFGESGSHFKTGFSVNLNVVNSLKLLKRRDSARRSE